SAGAYSFGLRPFGVPQGVGEGPTTCRIVPAVEPQLGTVVDPLSQWSFRQSLHARRPENRDQPTFDRSGFPETQSLEVLGRGNGGTRVDDLMLPDQGGQRQIH